MGHYWPIIWPLLACQYCNNTGPLMVGNIGSLLASQHWANIGKPSMVQYCLPVFIHDWANIGQYWTIIGLPTPDQYWLIAINGPILCCLLGTCSVVLLPAL